MGIARLTYLFDPLCGWCYGAAPAIATLCAAGGVVELAPVGLFAGDGAFVANDSFARHVRAADQRIAALTDQPFSDRYRAQLLGQRGVRIDSGPATLALTAVHLTDPAREGEALAAIQRSRYVDGLDTSIPAVVAEVIAGLGLAAAARRLEAADAELAAADHARIEAGRAAMRLHRLEGVPALLGPAGPIPSGALFGPVGDLVAALVPGAKP